MGHDKKRPTGKRKKRLEIDRDLTEAAELQIPEERRGERGELTRVINQALREKFESIGWITPRLKPKP
jgi:hypothetical protein